MSRRLVSRRQRRRGSRPGIALFLLSCGPGVFVGSALGSGITIGPDLARVLPDNVLDAAVAAAREGDRRHALALLEEAQGDPRTGSDARFLLGILAADERDLARARAALEKSRQEHSFLGGYATYRLALLERESGAPGRALALLRELRPESLSPHLHRLARLAEGDLLRQRGLVGEATAVWEALAGDSVPASSPSSTADSVRLAALEQLALTAIRQHDWAAAQRWNARLWSLDPASPQGREAHRRSATLTVRRLAPAPVEDPATVLRGGVALARARRWSEAGPLLRSLLRRGDRNQRAEALLWLGHGALAREILEEARRHYRGSLEVLSGSSPEDEAASDLRAEALLGLLRAELEGGTTKTCVAAWEDLRTGAPHSAGYRRGTQLLAAHLAAHRDLPQAASIIGRWLADSSGLAGREEMAWELGRLLLSNGDRLSAREVLQELLAAEDSGFHPAGLFWMSRLLDGEGLATRADSLARELNAQYPLSYYAYRMRELRGECGFWPAAVGRLPAGAPVGAHVLESPTAPDAPGWRRAMALRRLGLHVWARLELAGLEDGGWPGKEVEPAMAGVALETGRWNEAVRITRDFYEHDLVAGRPDLPLVVWEAAYPVPYRQQVEEAAAASGLDPFLLWAMAREESDFNPRARSRAGALGLLQLIPRTARELAVRDVRPATGATLLEPGNNLWLGARYFAGLVSRWPENLPLALAAYNAGPARAARWWGELDRRDPDRFLESIPIRETRVYVKAVLRVYFEYRRLYRGDTAPRAAFAGSSQPTTATASGPQGKPER